MKLAFVPIDNRPVCYTLPKLLAEIDESVEFYIPDPVSAFRLPDAVPSDEIHFPTDH